MTINALEKTRPEDNETRAENYTLEAFADHRMKVVQDDGVHRHLVFKHKDRDKAWNMWFEIVTWPGHLYIGGDIEGFVFQRTHDMFQFFRGSQGNINPYYWSEKLVTKTRWDVQKWSEQVFEQMVDEHLSESECDDVDKLKEAWKDHSSWTELTDQDTALEALSAFTFDGKEVFTDVWEWECYEWDIHFLYACWAIVRGIGIYDWTRSYNDMEARS